MAVNILITNIILLFKSKEAKKLFINFGIELVVMLLPILGSNWRYNHYEEQGTDTEAYRA